jgi:GPH family glycoside/pentoside/hexuronide:cation symporter
MKNDKQNVRPFGRRDEIGYMFGNAGADLSFMLCNAFLMKFYTDVMGVSAAIIGVMMMVAQIVDALTDLTMGQICDKSPETPNGKFRPWIRRMAGPVSLSCFLMFAAWFRNMNMTFKVIWMFATYLLYCSVFYTAFIVPYGSMATAITADPDERTALANMRHIGATIASTCVSVTLPLIVYYVDSSGNQQLSGTKMVIAAAIISILSFIFYILCYHMTTERVKIPSTNQGGMKATLKAMKDTLNNRAMIGVALVVIIYEIGRSSMTGMNAYIYPNYLNNVSAQSVAGIVEVVVTLLMTLVVVPFVRKVGKREASAIGMAFSAAILLITYFMHTHSAVVWIVMDALVFVGLGIWGPVQWSLVGDIVDDTEIKTGTRADGGIYGVFSFSRKLGQALASGVRGFMLTAIGYSTATCLEETVLNGVYSIATVVPAIAYIAMIVVLMTVYPLSKKKVEENARLLAEKGR